MLQKDEDLATAHELNQSFQTLHFNAAANITEISKKLEQFFDVLENFNDAEQRYNPITIAGIEEFPSFTKPMVQAAVNSATEWHFQNLENSPALYQQRSNDTHSIVNIDESEKLEGGRKSAKRPIPRFHRSRMTKTYRFWFGKVRIEKSNRGLYIETFNDSQIFSIYKALWHARLLVMPEPWISSTASLEYITRENRRTSFQINIEPIGIIPVGSSVFRDCYKGDLKAFHQLIEDGQASRYD